MLLEKRVLSGANERRESAAAENGGRYLRAIMGISAIVAGLAAGACENNSVDSSSAPVHSINTDGKSMSSSVKEEDAFPIVEGGYVYYRNPDDPNSIFYELYIGRGAHVEQLRQYFMIYSVGRKRFMVDFTKSGQKPMELGKNSMIEEDNKGSIAQ